jgi:hypothetical protein
MQHWPERPFIPRLKLGGIRVSSLVNEVESKPFCWWRGRHRVNRAAVTVFSLTTPPGVTTHCRTGLPRCPGRTSYLLVHCRSGRSLPQPDARGSIPGTDVSRQTMATGGQRPGLVWSGPAGEMAASSREVGSVRRRPGSAREAHARPCASCCSGPILTPQEHHLFRFESDTLYRAGAACSPSAVTVWAPVQKNGQVEMVSSRAIVLLLH